MKTTYRMTSAQKTYYDRGVDDRQAERPMAETFTMQPHVQNAYTNGYRDACEEAAK